MRDVDRWARYGEIFRSVVVFAVLWVCLKIEHAIFRAIPEDEWRFSLLFILAYTIGAVTTNLYVVRREFVRDVRRTWKDMWHRNDPAYVRRVILMLLSTGRDMTTYQMIRAIDALDHDKIVLGFNGLYNYLWSMREDGLIDRAEGEDGRFRYAITDKGMQVLAKGES